MPAPGPGHATGKIVKNYLIVCRLAEFLEHTVLVNFSTLIISIKYGPPNAACAYDA